MAHGEELAPLIAQASEQMAHALIHEGKILFCGSGTSAALAQLGCALLSHRFERERPSLPALCLHGDSSSIMALGNTIFSRPIGSLGQPGDCLFILSGGSNATEFTQAITAAHDRDMTVIAVTTPADHDLRSLLSDGDSEIFLGEERCSRRQELQLLLLHCLCDLIDLQLFGGDEA